ncbi:hypothetical protein CW735_15565 [Alteromonas sp. MB-3u-76]|uniref:hypothetical protein n=1 Tax=Alteromonas sp. MB-3u-76 TaxID=2058133 RepID=UPI000C30427C|nr:hypothetical protein [Alteromonas sp. MB-3u-76]AUC89433.1 hypothetical protein CW735_15565 [Alteromonas sp. MB-3u-76]
MLEFIGFLVVCWIGFVIVKAVYIGWLRGKKSGRKEGFTNEIEQTVTLFASEISFINDRQTDELIEVCTNRYLNREKGEENHSVFDIVFNTVTGLYMEQTMNDNLPVNVSLQCWRESDKFLRNHPKFDSELTQSLLSCWSNILIKKGVDPFNFQVAV